MKVWVDMTASAHVLVFRPLIRLLRDPALPGLLLMAALVVAGFAAITIGYFGAARLIYVPLQMPEIVSGGVGGLALIGVGAYLFGVQIDRQHAAREEMLRGEKEFTRARDELTRARRELPWSPVEKTYVFDGPAGK